MGAGGAIQLPAPDGDLSRRRPRTGWTKRTPAAGSPHGTNSVHFRKTCRWRSGRKIGGDWPVNERRFRSNKKCAISWFGGLPRPLLGWFHYGTEECGYADFAVRCRQAESGLCLARGVSRRSALLTMLRWATGRVMLILRLVWVPRSSVGLQLWFGGGAHGHV